jgi:hypothetical protein
MDMTSINHTKTTFEKWPKLFFLNCLGDKRVVDQKLLVGGHILDRIEEMKICGPSSESIWAYTKLNFQHNLLHGHYSLRNGFM